VKARRENTKLGNQFGDTERLEPSEHQEAVGSPENVNQTANGERSKDMDGRFAAVACI
jgi:hypothetical protein